MNPPVDIPRPEYPRPHFVRSQWLNLNGEWGFAFDDDDRGIAEGWFHGLQLPLRIRVPFPYQSELSGINDKAIHQVVWYSREFEIPGEWRKMNLLLHFGAVDYRCTVWVNGQEVGHNQGGHTPFYFNIAPYLNPGPNRIMLRVVDSQSPQQPRGKQSVSGKPHDIDYYCSSGIWQTVWLEPVPPLRIQSIRIAPTAKDKCFQLTLFLHAPCAQWRVEVDAFDADQCVAHTAQDVTSAVIPVHVAIPDAKLWSPDSPFLYQFRVRLFHGDAIVDEVQSYGGLRDFELTEGRCFLNGKPIYLKMVLDQGYWPQGYLAAPSDEALRADVQWTKRFGFNGARKHQKIEDPRWLYWCDRLGLLVWSEMPNAREWSSAAEEMLAAEWIKVLARDSNHPCIVTWVPINESMGFPGLKESHPAQYDFIERMVLLTRRHDSAAPSSTMMAGSTATSPTFVRFTITLPPPISCARAIRKPSKEANFPRMSGSTISPCSSSALVIVASPSFFRKSAVSCRCPITFRLWIEICSFASMAPGILPKNLF